MIRSRAGELALAEADVAPVKALLAQGRRHRRRPRPRPRPAAGAGRQWPWWGERAGARVSVCRRPPGCARIRCAGSAPQARRWLLLEHPGPWPVDAVAGSGHRSGRAGGPAAGRGPVGRPHPAGPPAGSRRSRGRPPLDADRPGPGHGRRSVEEDQTCGRRPTALTADPDAGGGVGEPIMLVCTHGVHDACCAIRGRPVAAALAAEWPGQVWECSHVGGDRFAPNVVLLPDGFYYGNLDPESAVHTVRQHLAGARGGGPAPRRGQRSRRRCRPRSVAAYERLGPLAPNAVTVESVHQVGPHHGHGSETTVELRVGRRADGSEVEVWPSAGRRPSSTCRALPGDAGHRVPRSCRSRRFRELEGDADDLVVVPTRVGPAVGVAGGHPQRAVRSDHHVPDPAVVLGEVRLRARRASSPERHREQALAPQGADEGGVPGDGQAGRRTGAGRRPDRLRGDEARRCGTALRPRASRSSCPC